MRRSVSIRRPPSSDSLSLYIYIYIYLHYIFRSALFLYVCTAHSAAGIWYSILGEDREKRGRVKRKQAQYKRRSRDDERGRRKEKRVDSSVYYPGTFPARKRERDTRRRRERKKGKKKHKKKKKKREMRKKRSEGSGKMEKKRLLDCLPMSAHGARVRMKRRRSLSLIRKALASAPDHVKLCFL